jgi:protein SCO1/2
MKIRPLQFAFAILAAAALTAAAWYMLSGPRSLHGEVIEPPQAVSDFTLQSTHGPVALSSFHGRVVVLYFGYTSCPDLCPTTLATMHQALESLGAKASEVQVVFVSVDWKRDTADVMAKYVSHFDPGFVGLSGTREQIDAVTREIGIFYLLNLPDANGFYSVDHTASTRVLDRQGRLVAIWPYEMSSEEMASDLRVLLKRNPESALQE